MPGDDNVWVAQHDFEALAEVVKMARASERVREALPFEPTERFIHFTAVFSENLRQRFAIASADSKQHRIFGAIRRMATTGGASTAAYFISSKEAGDDKDVPMYVTGVTALFGMAYTKYRHDVATRKRNKALNCLGLIEEAGIETQRFIEQAATFMYYIFYAAIERLENNKGGVVTLANFLAKAIFTQLEANAYEDKSAMERLLLCAFLPEGHAFYGPRFGKKTKLQVAAEYKDGSTWTLEGLMCRSPIYVKSTGESHRRFREGEQAGKYPFLYVPSAGILEVVNTSSKITIPPVTDFFQRPELFTSEQARKCADSAVYQNMLSHYKSKSSLLADQPDLNIKEKVGVKLRGHFGGSA